MKDPSRLLESTRNRRECSGLERALLRSAYGDRAPDAVRARVLESVNEVLFSGGTPRGPVSGAAPRLPAPRLPASSAAGKRGLLLRVVHAAYLGGGLLAAAAGVGVVMLQQSTLSPAGGGDLPPSSLAWLPGPARPAQASVNPALPAPASRSKPARLASLAPGDARAARLGQSNALASTHSDHLRPGAVSDPAGRSNLGSSNLGSSNLPGNPPARLRNDGPEDWLGAQLRLLREAREQLHAGRLEQAERVLNSYGPRFPGGVLGPQVNGLREELSERRTTARAVAGHGIPLR